MNNEWELKYELACSYYNHYGNLKVPRNFKTKNGIDYDKDGILLGEWVSRQRRTKNLSKDRIIRLQNIGMIFESIYDYNWNKYYKLAENYYNHYGNLLIPSDFKTKNGIDYSADGESLGMWISSQRQAFNGTNTRTINDERIKKLENIGMIFENIRNYNWNKYYELACAYYNHYGNLEIPEHFITKNGIDYDKEGIKLGNWIVQERKAYNFKDLGYELSQEEINKLSSIGMLFENLKDINWNKHFKLAESYYNHYGDLLVPCGFKTKNGIDYDKDGFDLHTWITKIKNIYNTLGNEKYSKEQIKQLKNIGMNFDSLIDAKWMKNYKLACAYYNHYGNLLIPSNFITKNGIDYDITGEKIGWWLVHLRKAYKGKQNCKITDEQIKMLENIKMVWYIRKDYYKKSNKEKITNANRLEKYIEVSNRLKTYLNKLDGNTLPNKKQLNNLYLHELDRKTL